MTSFRQIHANRRNARKSTGPPPKKANSVLAVIPFGMDSQQRVIGALEEYQAFAATIIADYDVQSTVEREVVLRLASLLWRLQPRPDDGNRAVRNSG
jgi:hypothetical protein